MPLQAVEPREGPCEWLRQRQIVPPRDDAVKVIEHHDRDGRREALCQEAGGDVGRPLLRREEYAADGGEERHGDAGGRANGGEVASDPPRSELGVAMGEEAVGVLADRHPLHTISLERE